MLAIHKKHFVKQSKHAFFRFPNFLSLNNKLIVFIPPKAGYINSIYYLKEQQRPHMKIFLFTNTIKAWHKARRSICKSLHMPVKDVATTLLCGVRKRILPNQPGFYRRKHPIYLF
jgi:hypothetical protein